MLWTLDYLLGRWRFKRLIPRQGSMSGDAVFESAWDGVALYRESGELHLENGGRLRGEQRYVYVGVDGGFDILFYDTGALFQRVMLRMDGADWCGTAEHLCAADTYASEYRFRAADTFSTRHAVRGPRKDYVICTVYVRVD